MSHSNLLHAANVPVGTKLAKEQILNVSLIDNPSTLDPQFIPDIVSQRLVSDLFEGLMTEAEDGTIIYGIAKRYELSDDGKTYTFYLKENAKFSDGSLIQASDVVFSFRRLVDPKTASTYSFITHPIKNAEFITVGKMSPTTLGVEAINSSTIKITLEHPVSYFPSLVSMPMFGIVKEDNVNQFPTSFTQPGKLVTSGAYKLKSWRVGDKITAVKNDYYWDQSNTIIQTVHYIPVSDGNSELQMYHAGQIDMTNDVPSEKIKYLRSKIPKEIKINPKVAMYYFDFNMRKEPFKNNLKLRKAFSMAIDREILTKNVLGRGETPAYDLVPKGILNYEQQNYEWSTWSSDKRLAEAKLLFKESGYSVANPLHITVTYNTENDQKKITLALVSMWQKAFGKLGLKLTVESQELKVFLRTRQQGAFQIARDGWYADYNDASTFTNLLISKNTQNNSGYHNLEYDKIQNNANLEQDIMKRKIFFEKGMRLALNDYPVMPLYNYVSVHLIKPYIGGYSGCNPLDHMHVKNLYIMEK